MQATLPGQLPYADDATQAAYVGLAKRHDAAMNKVQRLESKLRQARDDTAWAKQRLREVESARTKSELARQATQGTPAEAKYKAAVTAADTEIEHRKEKLTRCQDAEQVAQEAFTEARDAAEQVGARMQAVQEAA